MATTEERLAALEQKMQMLTTPPDDYYMSRWTGEEIDAAVATAVNAISKIVKDYSGTEAPDIDTILDSSFVIPASASKNCPVAGNYIIIYQFFYAPSGTVSAARPRTQIALPYSAGVQGKGMALRTFSRESVWSGWEKIYTAQQPPAAAEVGAAPSGFGLGEVVGKTVFSWDEALENGFYKAPAPSGFGSGNIWGRVVSLSETYKYQEIYIDTVKATACRFMLGGIWQPFEWENPPMQLGVEYRTTERYNGKPVYKKLVDIGYLPNNSTKAISDWASDVYQVIEVYGRAHIYAIPTEYYGSDGSYVRIFIGSNVMSVSTNSDRSDTPASVVVKYTKTTD